MGGPLPFPSFYEADNAACADYWPNQQRLLADAERWRSRYAIAPSSTDRFNVHLLLVDMQKDFCLPEGSLFVAGRSGRGALEDSRRIAEFIYRELGRITHITTTLDSHLAYQIFSPSFWLGADGRHPAPHREINLADLEAGRFRPNPAVAPWVCNNDYEWLQRQVRYYCEELEREGKYKLYLWPPHCIIGSDGHALVGLVHEARLFHDYVRQSQSWIEIKGNTPLTENYSVLRPEVLTRHDGGVLAEKNTRFLERLLEADAVLLAGQAASHCVRFTIEDLLSEISARDPRLAEKFYLLTDCMSCVAVADPKGGFAVDFTERTEKAFERFAAAGIRLVRSTEPLEGWPGLEGVFGS
ncbi:MAG: nicotinamidase [Myxococcales bacterium]|jgi:nicotinamidase-related amidase